MNEDHTKNILKYYHSNNKIYVRDEIVKELEQFNRKNSYQNKEYKTSKESYMEAAEGGSQAHAQLLMYM